MSGSTRTVRVSFQTKVLVPVVGIMVLLVVVPLWLVTRRMSAQFETATADNLRANDAVFQNLQTIRSRDLLLRYGNVPNEPRFKAVLLKAVVATSDPKTLSVLLNDLRDELGGDVAMFADAEARNVANAARDERFPSALFSARAAPSIHRALAAEPNVDILSVGNRVFEVVSIPVNVRQHVVGVLVFGSEVGEAAAREFTQLTRSEVVLLADRNIVTSTLRSPELASDLRNVLAAFSAAGPSGPSAGKLTIDREHFMYVVGQLGRASPTINAGYILLSSYEKPWRVLRDTERTFLWIQSLGILLGTAGVWLYVRRVTRPLRELRNSAEAVGRGDFSRRVEAASRDECGELAIVFNQMTMNLNTSRHELEKTVETLRTTQAQLVQSEKLRAIGTLASGIAHDFNNILGAILGFGELVLEDVAASGRTARNMRQVLKAGQRAKDLVRQILTFSRHGESQRATIRLGTIINEVMTLLRATIPATVRMETRLNAAEDTVVADPTQLHQVLMNLGTNASYAMRHRSGTLTVTLDDFTVPASGDTKARHLSPGRYLRLAVADTGYGMTPQVLERIFEPFFTTKPVGEGTGLGLSVVHGIIKEHGGDITVASEPGVGTTFHVFLPQAKAAAEATSGADEPVHGCQERILIVDDEEPLVNMMQQKLARLGYEVVAHHDSLAALKEFEAAPQRFDLVITDQIMPRLTGTGLAREVFRVRSTTPVILCSGSGHSFLNAESLRPAVSQCVPKPVNFGELSRVIRRVLADRPTLADKQP